MEGSADEHQVRFEDLAPEVRERLRAVVTPGTSAPPDDPPPGPARENPSRRASGPLAVRFRIEVGRDVSDAESGIIVTAVHGGASEGKLNDGASWRVVDGGR
jgi:hypothetical protein